MKQTKTILKPILKTLLKTKLKMILKIILQMMLIPILKAIRLTMYTKNTPKAILKSMYIY